MNKVISETIKWTVLVFLCAFSLLLLFPEAIWNAFNNAVGNLNADPMYCRTDISDRECYITRSECVSDDRFTCKEQRAVYCADGKQRYSWQFVCVDSVESGKKIRDFNGNNIGKDLDWVKTNRDELGVFCKVRKDADICKRLYEKE
jgi:hypothetical protein